MGSKCLRVTQKHDCCKHNSKHLNVSVAEICMESLGYMPGVQLQRMGGWIFCVCSIFLHPRYFCLQVTVEEVMTTTAYLDLFLRSVSEPALLKIFLRFILLHQHENVHILDTLTSRINTPFRVRQAGMKFRYSSMDVG